MIDKNDDTPVKDKDTGDFINTFFTEIGSNLAKDMNTPWTYQGDEPDSNSLLGTAEMYILSPSLKMGDSFVYLYLYTIATSSL